MDPRTASDMLTDQAGEAERRALENLAEEEDELDEDDEDEDDMDDEDEDDEVGTDERGKEMLKAPAANEYAPQQTQAPDVSSDRVPATDAEPEGSLDRVEAGPLGIQEIENLEDDSRGG